MSAVAPVASMRHRFPGVQDGWARFDGPAGTQVVDTAITAMTQWLTDGRNGCGGGHFAAAQAADALVERTRATVGQLFHADPDGIVAQQYSPDDVDGTDYYHSTSRGAERDIGARLEKLRAILRRGR